MRSNIFKAFLTATVILFSAPSEAVKIPNSLEGLKKLSHQELIELYNHLDSIYMPMALTFFGYLDAEYGVKSMSGFAQTFPRTYAVLKDIASQNQNTFGASMKASSFQAQQGAPDLSLSDLKSILLYGANYSDAVHRKLLSQALFTDIQHQCDCSKEEVDLLLAHWAEEWERASVDTISCDVSNPPEVADPDSPNAHSCLKKLLFETTLAIEAILEVADRINREEKICRAFNNAHFVVTLAPGISINLTDFCDGNPGDDRFCDISPGNSPTDNQSGDVSNQQGNLYGLPAGPPLLPGGGDTIDVIDDFNPLPPHNPGDDPGGGTPPLFPTPPPDDPTVGCIGPCCDRPGGGGAGCWVQVDGFPMPCWMVHQAF